MKAKINHKETIKEFLTEIRRALRYWKSYALQPSFYIQIAKQTREEFSKNFPEESKKRVRYSFYLTFFVLILTVPLFIYTKVNGQQVVYDPTANTHLVNNVQQTTVIAKSMNESLEMMKKANQALTKVSNAVRDLESVERIANDQKYMLKLTQDTYNAMKKGGSFSPREIGDMMMNFNRVLDNTLRTVSIATSVMKDHYLQMNDGERVKMMLELEATVNSQRRELQGIATNYYTLRNKRYMYGFFKKSRN